MSEAKDLKVFPKANVSSESEAQQAREETRQILETIIKKMVNQPESIKVGYQIGERTTIFTVDCSKESIGRLIGSKGRNIASLRQVVCAIMSIKGIRAIIEIPYYKNDE